ncbi:MAG: C4-type zinc ribbon domain-containing protein [Treponema sp.]|nr:C4-type zinc ribbon domain-containing protein [Treponema sp.]
METTEIFERLKTLQDILVQKYDLEAKVEEAPKQLSSQEELLSRLKKEFIVKNADYETIKDKVLKLRAELEEAIKSREAGEKGMDNITTHREYEALEKQIAEATDKENELRKDLQKEEKSLEELKENLKIDEDMINSQEADLAASKESLNAQLADYESQLKALKEEEDKIVPDMDQEILFKFERIIQRNSEGIVAVRNGVCTGCHMILPAQFANTVHENEEILFCPYCSRILFHEDAEEDETESFFTLKEAGSLADLDDFSDEEEELDEDAENENNEEYRDEDSDSYDDADDDLADEDSEEEVEE